MKKAIVIGGTGLVGTQLIKQLVEDEKYSEIVSLVRRSSGETHPKLQEIIVNFDQTQSWSHLVTGDVLFSALGTTIGQAKTKAAQFKVDYTYQYMVAKSAAENGVETYVLISSAGASSKSKVFYTSMKGQLEDAVQILPFKQIAIIRPGQLAGNRTENRKGEKIALSVMYFINKLGLLKQYRPIQASLVARAMINAVESEKSTSYSLDEVFELAK